MNFLSCLLTSKLAWPLKNIYFEMFQLRIWDEDFRAYASWKMQTRFCIILKNNIIVAVIRFWTTLLLILWQWWSAVGFSSLVCFANTLLCAWLVVNTCLHLFVLQLSISYTCLNSLEVWNMKSWDHFPNKPFSYM